MAGNDNWRHLRRDSRGRWTKSATASLSDAQVARAREVVAGFNPRRVTGNDRAALAALAPAEVPAAVQRYRDGGWREVNAALRANRQPRDVAAIDRAMTPLPEDIVVTRRVPRDVFGHDTLNVEALEGRSLRDAAYTSGQLGEPDGDAEGMVTIRMAVPAGTPAIVDPDTGEVLLARDAEVGIGNARRGPRGGWQLNGVVLGTRAPVQPRQRATSRATQGRAAPATPVQRAAAEQPTRARPDRPMPAPRSQELQERLGAFNATDQERLRVQAQELRDNTGVTPAGAWRAVLESAEQDRLSGVGAYARPGRDLRAEQNARVQAATRERMTAEAAETDRQLARLRQSDAAPAQVQAVRTARQGAQRSAHDVIMAQDFNRTVGADDVPPDAHLMRLTDGTLENMARSAPGSPMSSAAQRELDRRRGAAQQAAQAAAPPTPAPRVDDMSRIARARWRSEMMHAEAGTTDLEAMTPEQLAQVRARAVEAGDSDLVRRADIAASDEGFPILEPDAIGSAVGRSNEEALQRTAAREAEVAQARSELRAAAHLATTDQGRRILNTLDTQLTNGTITGADVSRELQAMGLQTRLDDEGESFGAALANGLTQDDVDDVTAFLREATEFNDPGTGLSVQLRNAFVNDDGSVAVNYDIRDASGAFQGDASRTWRRASALGFEHLPPRVSHDFLELREAVQGGGFAARWNRHMEDVYRANGIQRIYLSANIDVGGYAWAKQGYQFNTARSMLNKPKRRVDSLLDGVLPHEVQYDDAQLAELHAIQLRMTEDHFDAGTAPTPLEIAMAGWRPGLKMWPGKQVMLAAHWEGHKNL